jgi:hypothetical protein
MNETAVAGDVAECKQCGGSFIKGREEQVYCDRDCKDAAYNARRSEAMKLLRKQERRSA